jgi:hypothetical protein
MSACLFVPSYLDLRAVKEQDNRENYVTNDFIMCILH